MRISPESMRLLHEAGLDTPENMDVIENYLGSFDMDKVLSGLNEKGTLTAINVQPLFNCLIEIQASATQDLAYLRNAGLLTEAQRDVLENHRKPLCLAHGLRCLHNAGLLTDTNRASLIAHQGPRDLAYALIELHNADLLTDVNRDAMAGCQNPSGFCYVIKEGLVTDANRADVARQHDPELFLIALQELDEKGLLTDANRAAFAGCQDPSSLKNAILELHEASLLTDANREAIISHHNPIQLANSLITLHHAGLLTDANRDVLLAHPNACPNLALSTLHHAGLLTADSYFFTDPTSGVSTKKLLALFWLAIHDDTKRMGTLDDAKKQLIEGLYEAQRDYNLDETGSDNGAADDATCTSGTFNKLMEKLAGLHPDVEVVFMTRASAALKFQIVVNEEALLCLRALAKSPDERSIRQFTCFVDEIQPGEGLPALLWEQIAPNVSYRMFDEFGPLYPQGVESPEFQALFSSGLDVSLTASTLQVLLQIRQELTPTAALSAPGTQGFFGAHDKKDDADEDKEHTLPTADRTGACS